MLWKVELPDSEEIWTVNMPGVRLVHVTTQKQLAVTKEKYSEWGNNMTEVVATAKPSKTSQNLWSVDFIHYPKYSKEMFCT